MRELLRTNDPVLVSFAQSLLDDAGLQPLVADTHMSIVEGSLGVFPRRILVPSEAWQEARDLLTDAGLAKWLYDDAV